MGTPKVIVRGGKNEYAGRVREIVQKQGNIRIKIHCTFYDPDIQKYVLMKGEPLTFDTTSVSLALALKDKLGKFLFGDEG